MATMKDVALSAGVSTATVSRALMTPEKVSLSTRKRVEDAVLETGYSPTTLTRTLRRNESKTIVTIVPDICDPYFSDIIRGIEDAAVENGYVILVGDSSQQKKNVNTPLLTLYTPNKSTVWYYLVQTSLLTLVAKNKKIYRLL